MSHETNEVPINPVRPMNAPAGLDLRPKPPSSVRVSKRAGIAVSCLLAVILAGFAYGGYKRQVRQEPLASADTLQPRPPALRPASGKPSREVRISRLG